MFAQVAVALLCAVNNNMSTTTLVPLCRRVGLTCVRCWSKKRAGVQSRLPNEYITALSVLVWGSVEKDPMLKAFG